MAVEFEHDGGYYKLGQYRVSEQLFIDLIFNNKCNFACPFCIANTKDFAEKHSVLGKNENVFGLVPYKKIKLYNQDVILKYQQVEDKYDLDRDIPTLKNLSKWQCV